MNKIFIKIYEWFSIHTKVFYITLVAIVGLCAVMASQITLQENITSFFSDSEEDKNAIFDNVKAKDKIIVMLTGDDPDSIIESAELFEENVNELMSDGLVNSITAYADEELIEKCTSFEIIYSNA